MIDKKDGPFEDYYSNRNLKVKVTYKNGNGNLKVKVTYKNGEREGPFEDYYSNGNPKSKGTYKNGKLEGPEEVYYDNGQLQSKRIYKDGVLIQYASHARGRQDSRRAGGSMSQLTDRDNAIIRLAVHRFMTDAYDRLAAAAQDKEGRYFRPGAADSFAKDAKDAEALLDKLPVTKGEQAI